MTLRDYLRSSRVRIYQSLLYNAADVFSFLEIGLEAREF